MQHHMKLIKKQSRIPTIQLVNVLERVFQLLVIKLKKNHIKLKLKHTKKHFKNSFFRFTYLQYCILRYKHIYDISVCVCHTNFLFQLFYSFLFVVVLAEKKINTKKPYIIFYWTQMCLHFE